MKHFISAFVVLLLALLVAAASGCSGPDSFDRNHLGTVIIPKYTVSLAETSPLPTHSVTQATDDAPKILWCEGCALLTVDGVTPPDASNVRVLVMGEPTSEDSGIYRLSENDPWGWQLYHTDDYYQLGDYVLVTDGVTWGGKLFQP